MPKKRSAEEADLQDRHGGCDAAPPPQTTTLNSGNDAPLGVVSHAFAQPGVFWDTARAQLSEALPGQYDAYALLVRRTPGSQTPLGGWKSAAATESNGGWGDGHGAG